MNLERLSPAFAKSLFENLRDHLRKADRVRLRQLIVSIRSDGKGQVSEVLPLIFPGKDHETALVEFHQLQERIQQAALEGNLDFSLASDSTEHDATNPLEYWFEGMNEVEEQVTRYSLAESELPMSGGAVAQNAVVLPSELEFRNGKRVVRYFVSYARANARLQRDLVSRLQAQLSLWKEFDFESWEHSAILPGENWFNEIQAAITACHFGLLLVSAEFLNSRFILEHELSRFLPRGSHSAERRRIAVPVGLRKMPLNDEIDLKGLHETQVFRDSAGKFFSERATDDTKDRFAEQLSRKIFELTKKRFQSDGDSSLRCAASTKESDPHGIVKLQRDSLLDQRGSQEYVNALGVETDLDKWNEDHHLDLKDGEPLDAIEYLMNWACSVGEPNYCALLGEYGIGKTTTCRAFSRALLEARENDPDLPIPVYLDLRKIGATAKENPSLSEILERVIARSWRGGRLTPEIGAEEVMYLIQEKGGVAVFDGLDEVLVHLSPPEGQLFTRELWRILPPKYIGRRCKVLISCRSHFFRTIRDQKNHFVGEEREGLHGSDYRALLLLPFTSEQVEEFLSRNLPMKNIEKILDLIRSVHNLPELAERPYTLSLIAQHIEKLERLRSEGEVITGVTLYRQMVLSWLERDQGKHQLTPDHKLRLMEDLAARMWRSGKQSWAVDDVEQWLVDYLADQRRMAAHYLGKDIETLKEDLRAATFLVRKEEDQFQFAHTSLQEFFLASFLCRALEEGRIDDWNMPIPSKETLEFLGQLTMGASTEEILLSLRTIRSEYRSEISELGLAYMLSAQEEGYPYPGLEGFQLQGAQLRYFRIRGKSGRSEINFANSSFRGADLRDAQIVGVGLENTDFSHANMSRTELLSTKAAGARFNESILKGTVFRETCLDGASFINADLYRTQWSSCQLRGVEGFSTKSQGALFTICEPESFNARLDLDKCEDFFFEAPGEHTNGINRCWFLSCGERVLSSAWDGTLRIWDAYTGESLQVLRGHHDGAFDCAISRDESMIASAGADGLIYLWNARTGEKIRSLKGHSSWVRSCVFSPGGNQLASTGDDETVRLWNIETGECIHMLRGHSDLIWSCSFSPDGKRLVSSGADGTVRLWIVETGKCLSVLNEADGRVFCCAYSPSGNEVVAAGEDESVRIFDASTGNCLQVLRGHTGSIWSCAFSRNGKRVVTSGDDNTIRLWDVFTGENQLTIEWQGSDQTFCNFSPNGSQVVSSGSDRSIRILDVGTGHEILRLGGNSRVYSYGVISPDGRRFGTIGSSGQVRVWAPSSGQEMTRLEGYFDHGQWLAFSPDGGQLISSNTKGEIKVWDASTGRSLFDLQGHASKISSVRYSLNGKQVISSAKDGTIRIWDADAGECSNVLEHATDFEFPQTRDAICDDRRIVAINSRRFTNYGGKLCVWNIQTDKQLLNMEFEDRHFNAWNCVISPDCNLFAYPKWGGTIPIRSTSTGKMVLELKGHSGQISSCAFSLDGQQLVSSGKDGTIRVWNIHTGECTLRIDGDAGRISRAAFSSDGGLVATSSGNGTTRVWNLHTGQPQLVVQQLPDGEYAVLSGDQTKVIQASPDAWRWLALMVRDCSGILRRYPAEILGPLPTH